MSPGAPTRTWSGCHRPRDRVLAPGACSAARPRRHTRAGAAPGVTGSSGGATRSGDITHFPRAGRVAPSWTSANGSPPVVVTAEVTDGEVVRRRGAVGRVEAPRPPRRSQRPRTVSTARCDRVDMAPRGPLRPAAPRLGGGSRSTGRPRHGVVEPNGPTSVTPTRCEQNSNTGPTVATTTPEACTPRSATSPPTGTPRPRRHHRQARRDGRARLNAGVGRNNNQNQPRCKHGGAVKPRSSSGHLAFAPATTAPITIRSPTWSPSRHGGWRRSAIPSGSGGGPRRSPSVTVISTSSRCLGFVVGAGN